MPQGKEAVEYNWLPIVLIIGALFFFTQQKGCDLENINLPDIYSRNEQKTLNIKEPTDKYKTTKLDVFRTSCRENKQKAAALAAFYFAYADIIERNLDKFKDKFTFRTQHSKALDLTFKNDLAMREPELGTEIENYLQEFISLDPGELDLEITKNALLSLAWAALQES